MSVDRFGGAPYRITPSAGDRVTRDPIVSGLGAIAAALAAISAVADMAARFANKKKAS